MIGRFLKSLSPFARWVGFVCALGLCHGLAFREWAMTIVLTIALVVLGRKLQTHRIWYRNAMAQATPEQLSLWDRELDS